MNHPKPISVWAAYTIWRERGEPVMAQLDFIKSRNRVALCRVATLIDLMCHSIPGSSFFLGSDALGDCLGVHGAQALRWLKALEMNGLITRTWTGGLRKVDRRGEPYKCGLRLVRDARGVPYPAGPLTPRASEYTYNGTDVHQTCV